ncbi:MAG: YfhO family protein [Eubacteriales bacterium]|nr:YfhO family protein [Eubacteriales bacterium]
MKNSKEKKLMYLAAFFIPVFVVVLIYAASSVWPLGEQCFLKTDMYHQYAPFMQELRNKLQNGGSLFYTWNVGMGVNFTAIYAYYLASPVNWLVGLVSSKYVIEFMMLTVIVKIGLASVAETWYLSKKSGKAELSAAVFGILYALSGYVCAYYWNLMWLDCIVLFPLIIYGLEELVNERKMILYTVSLGICIFSNYYISIMICAFLVIYFVILNILSTPGSFRVFVERALRFGVTSLVAGGLAMVILIPEVYALSLTAAADSTFPTKWTEYFSIIEVLSRMLPAVNTEQGLNHWPNIYSGSIVLLLFPLYLMNKKISVKEKAVFVITELFLIASFSINVFNYIWHGLHYPNSLPARQSFLFVFLAIYMAYRAYMERKNVELKDIGTALMVAAMFILICQKGYDTKYYYIYSFYLALLFVALYALFMYLEKKGRLKKTYAYALILAVTCIEVTVNTSVTSLTTTSRTAYTKDNADVRELVSDIKAEDPGFYRFEKISRKTKNDGAWMSFPSVSMFSSVADAKLTSLFKKMGSEASTNAYSITGATPLVDMLFGVKYALFTDEPAESQGREFVKSSGNTYLYRNKYALPLGFMLPVSMSKDVAFSNENPTLLQNTLATDLRVSKFLIEESAGNLNKDEYSLTISQDGDYYAYVTNSSVKKVSVTYPAGQKTYDNLDRRYYIELGTLKEGDFLRFKSETEGKDMNMRVYRFDYDALKDAYDILNAQTLEITEFSDAKIKGTVTVDPSALGYIGDSAIMCLSIPFDEGFTFMVDGEKVQPIRIIADALTGVRIPAGTHEISINYVPKGLKLGLIISAISLLGLLLIIFLDLRGRKKAAEEMLTELEIRKHGDEGFITELDTDGSGHLEEFEPEELSMDKESKVINADKADKAAETAEDAYMEPDFVTVEGEDSRQVEDGTCEPVQNEEAIESAGNMDQTEETERKIETPVFIMGESSDK